MEWSTVQRQIRSSPRQIEMEDLRSRRATAIRVLTWLESESAYEEVYGPDSRDRHAAAERARIARFDKQMLTA